MSRLLFFALTLSFACEPNRDGDAPLLTDTTTRGACPDGACGATPRIDLSTVNFIGGPFPTTLDVGERLPLLVAMQNTGPIPWTNGPLGQFIRLYSVNDPLRLWGEDYYDNITFNSVAVGAVESFQLTANAPFVAGVYNYEFRMRDSSISTGFGTNFQTTITVQEQQRAYECSLVSENVPPRLGTNSAFPASFTVQNIGYAPWPAGFQLCENDGSTFGSLRCVDLASPVAPGGQTTINMLLRGPSLPGTYDLYREMQDRRVDGIGRFNVPPQLACIQLQVIVQLCGNNIPFDDLTEECDDGNTINGDGCSETCVIENARIIDLATTGGDRTIFGRGSDKALANVAYGDVVTGDTMLDVCVGEIDHVTIPNSMPPRGRTTAGRVSCYDGNGFFGGSDVTTPDGSAFNVIGATAGDNLGGSGAGRILIGDVTADGSVDLIISAVQADGPAEGRFNSGEVYVISSAELLTGTLDLANVGTATVTTIYGAAPSDNLRVIGFGDLTGDGARDLVLGAIYNDAAGTNAGVIYVVEGGVALGTGGTIDLATTPAFATIFGPAPDATLGAVVTLGRVDAGIPFDLVIAAPTVTAAGRDGAGIVWVLLGPLAGGTYDLNTDFDLRFLGGEPQQRLGASMLLGNVRGTDNVQDLILGIPGATNPAGDRVGRVDVFQGPIATLGTIDLATTVATVRIWGTDDDDRFGSSIAFGHYDTDFRLDIAVAASAADGPGNTRDAAGEVVIIAGHQNMAAEIFASRPSHLRVYGDISRAMMGAHINNLAFAGDLDANASNRGHDLCIGTYRGNALRTGRVDCFSSPF